LNTLDFGSTTVGVTSTLTCTLTASGNAVSISQVSVAGSGFSVSGINLPTVLSTGQSATVTVSIDPQAAGSISGTLTVISNAANSPTAVALTALASAPSNPVLSLSPISVSFGSVVMGSSSSQSVTISNIGNASTTVSQANVTGTGYSLSGLTLPLTLAAGASSSFGLNFAPSATGAVPGNVSLVSNASNSPANLPLSGTGTAAPTATLTANPASLSFGNVTVGSSGTQSISLSNTGNANLTISSIAPSGSGFSGSGITLPLTLTPGQSASYTAQFAPTAAGSASGQVSFVSSASNSPTSVSMAGTGAPVPTAQLTTNPTNISFGSVTLGSSGTQSISLSNTGNANLTISSITPSGSGFSGSGITLPLTLSPGQSANYTAKFAPTVAGSASGQVSFVSNAANSPISVSMTGTGAPVPTAQLTTNPTNLTFGNVTLGSSGTQSISLSNSGNANLTISSITPSGSGFSGSGITLPLTLSPGQSANYTAQFAPTAAGSASGQISFVSNASNSPTSVSMSGTGVTAPTAQLTTSPTSLAFGNVTVGSNGTQSISLSNTGNANLTISSITTSGAGFSGSGITVPLTLTPGQSASYTAQFSPTAAGSASGQISFVSNASNSPTLVSMSGTGVTAPAAQLTTNPASVSFGNTIVGNTGTQSIALSNTGNANLTISSITASGAGFSGSGITVPLTLTPGQSASYSAQFAPTVAGSASGQVSVVSNAPNSPTSVSLTGTGVAQVIQLTANPTSATFGNVTVGSSGTQSVSVSNSGNSNLTISSITTSGTGFSGSGITVPVTLTPGQSSTYTVKFTPTVAGSASGQISFVSNASNSPTAVTLSATGVAQVLQLGANPTSVSFGNVVLGNSASQTVTISNTGNVTVTISQVTTSGTGFSGSGVTVPLTLTPGQSANYTATFSPTSAGSASGQISFVSNASNSPTLVSLTGTGIGAQLTATPTTLNFNNVDVGASSTLSGTLTASGGTVTVSSATVTGTGYSITGITFPVTLTAGQSTSFKVILTPTAVGSIPGTLKLVSNASNSPFTMTLSGTGVNAAAGPCGKIDDGLTHTPPSYNTFAAPALGTGYIDPQYGCTVVRLTNGISQFGFPGHHYYGTIAAFSADDSKVMLFLDNGSPAIVDTGGNIVVTPGSMPASNTNVYPWDPVNPAVFYFTNTNQFLKGTVSGSSVSSTAMHTFSGYSSCTIPDQEDLSDDGTKIWLVCTPSGQPDTSNVAVLYNLATNTVISNSLVVGAKEGGWHKIQIFPSGKMFLTGGSMCNSTQCIYNTDGTLYWQPPFTYSGHSDVGTDLQGREVLISTASGTASLNACGSEMWSSMTVIDINAKAPVNCLIGAPPRPKIPSWEISYRDSANSATGKWALLSMFDQGTCPDYSCFYPQNLASAWQSLWAPYYEELVLVKVDGSQTYRLAYTWSRSAENYWAVPRASISRDGRYLVFDSNFDISNTGFVQYTDVYMIKIQ
jgi:hypothetical protein